MIRLALAPSVDAEWGLNRDQGRYLASPLAVSQTKVPLKLPVPEHHS
jgi:hypothetical protein